MKHVTGIGGFFFRAKNPTALGQWYKENLGIDLTPADYSQKPWSQEAGPTVFAPFPHNTDYFGNPDRNWNQSARSQSGRDRGLPVRCENQCCRRCANLPERTVCSIARPGRQSHRIVGAKMKLLCGVHHFTCGISTTRFESQAPITLTKSRAAARHPGVHRH